MRGGNSMEKIRSTMQILEKIEAIEKDVMDLRLTVLKKLAPTGTKIISLKGILKGVKVTDEDIAAGRKSLYSKIRV
jgi:hypothetical protein